VIVQLGQCNLRAAECTVYKNEISDSLSHARKALFMFNVLAHLDGYSTVLSV